jgi:hypothetical protein
MARLNFRFTPRDTADFDVCADPPRPEPPPAEPAKAADVPEADDTARPRE